MKREMLISVVGLALAVGAGERIGLLDECRYDAAKPPEGGAARALLAANPDAGTAVASNAVSLLGLLNVGVEKRVTVGDGRVWTLGAANWAREYVLYSAPSGEVETCDISIAGETTKFVRPAYVDLATGEYFALSAPVRTATGWTFKDVPVAKTPRALTDRTFVRPLRWNKKFWRLTAAVKDDKLFYSVGEKPELVVSLTDEDGQPVHGEDVRVNIWWYRDGESTNELAEIGADGTVRRSMALDRPGYVGARVRLMALTQWHTPNSLRSIDLLTRTKDGKVQTVGGDIGVGVFFDPQKLVPHRTLPQRPAGAVASDKAAGFNPTNDVPYAEEVDEYWDRLLAKDREVEAAGGFASGELRYVRTAENGCKLYDTWMDSLGGRSYFQVSFPPEVEKGKKFPIWGIVQASGCYPPSAWTWPWAITVAPCAHSMDYSRDKSYRKEMREKIRVYYGFSSYF